MSHFEQYGFMPTFFSQIPCVIVIWVTSSTYTHSSCESGYGIMMLFVWNTFHWMSGCTSWSKQMNALPIKKIVLKLGSWLCNLIPVRRVVHCCVQSCIRKATLWVLKTSRIRCLSRCCCYWNCCQTTIQSSTLASNLWYMDTTYCAPKWRGFIINHR
jgi:hypothetical protein